MQADVLAGLLRRLDLAPAVIMGGSGGSRVSLLAASRHRDVARGGRLVDQRRSLRTAVAGQLLLRPVGARGVERGHGSGGRHPELEEVLERHPANRDDPRAQDPRSSSPRWSGGWPRTAAAPASSSPACPTTTPAGSTSRRWCSAAARPISTTPARPPSGSRAAPERPARRTAVAGHRVDRSGAGPLAGLRAVAAPGAAAGGLGEHDVDLSALGSGGQFMEWSGALTSMGRTNSSGP